MPGEIELKILGAGVDAWNAWRNAGKEPECVLPNLRQANLRSQKLQGIDLRSALLEDTDFTGADLSMADFSGAALENANLSQAYLIGARFCDYHNVAIARDYNMILQSPIAALFGDVNFDRAVLHRTLFIDLDVSKAKNLERCIHIGPSSLDHATLLKSTTVPIEFLRGCGLPETFIRLLPRASEFNSCFISYSSADDAFTNKLHSDLQDAGVRCWFAPNDLRIGDRTRIAIDSAITAHDKLLLVLSQTSVGSQWVEQEVEKALERERRENLSIVFPIRVDDAVLEATAGWAAYLRNTRNIGDFREWKGQKAYARAVERLLRDLRR